MNPTYQSGFYAPGRGTALHPELWRGCVGAWNPGLGNSGLVLRDWSGSQNHGVLTNGPTWRVSGGQNALGMDGGSDYIAASAIKVPEITFEVWFYNVVVRSYQYFINMEPNYTMSVHFGPAGNLFLRGGSTASISTSITAYLSKTQWAHLAVTIKGTSGAIFVNGVKIVTGTVAAMGASPTKTTFWGRSTSYDSNGSLGNFSVHSVALSDSTIQLLSKRPGIAYELAPRKSYFLPPTTSVNISANNMLIGTYL